MMNLGLAESGKALSILCLGAHSDDIEIGVGGTILSLINSGVQLHVDWCVMSAGGQRTDEARASARDFLKGAASSRVEVADFEDSLFPTQSRAIKKWLSELRLSIHPDIIFTHARNDAHQDHREISQLTWNVFRDQLILEYEIPKWDGDLGQPNTYVPLSGNVMERKIALLLAYFGTQRSKDWFDAETFQGLARIRGMECRAPERYAEAFVMRKARLF